MSTKVIPLELELEIFQLAAQGSSQCAASLAQVSHYVQEWVAPILYNTVRCDEVRVSPPIYHKRSLLDVPYLSKIGRYVKTIVIKRRKVEDIRTILQHCPNLSNLTLWTTYGNGSQLLPIMARLPLLHLSLDPSRFLGLFQSEDIIPFNHPAFASITHLEIINATPSNQKWHLISSIQNLSHLAFTGTPSPSLITHCLKHCRSLQRLIVFESTDSAATGGYSTAYQGVNDTRLRVLETPVHVLAMLGQWPCGEKDGPADIWAYCEGAEKLRRDVAPSSASSYVKRA